MGIIWIIKMVLLSTLAALVILVHSEEEHGNYTSKQLMRHVRDNFDQEWPMDEVTASDHQRLPNANSEVDNAASSDTRTNQYSLTRTGRRRKRPKITGHVSHKRHKDGHYHHSHHQRSFPKTFTLTDPEANKKIVLPELLIQQSELVDPKTVEKDEETVTHVTQKNTGTDLSVVEDTVVNLQPKQYEPESDDSDEALITIPKQWKKQPPTNIPAVATTFQMPSTVNLESITNVYRAPVKKHQVMPKMGIRGEDVDDMYLYREEGESPGDNEQLFTADHALFNEHRIHIGSDDDYYDPPTQVFERENNTESVTTDIPENGELTVGQKTTFIKKYNEHVFTKYPEPNKYSVNGDNKNKNSDTGVTGKPEKESDDDEDTDDPFERVVWKNSELIKDLPAISHEYPTSTSSSEEDEYALVHPHRLDTNLRHKTIFAGNKKSGSHKYLTVSNNRYTERPTPAVTTGKVSLSEKHLEHAERLRPGSAKVNKRRGRKKIPNGEFYPYSKKIIDYNDDHSLYSDINRPFVETVGVESLVFPFQTEKPNKKENQSFSEETEHKQPRFAKDQVSITDERPNSAENLHRPNTDAITETNNNIHKFSNKNTPHRHQMVNLKHNSNTDDKQYNSRVKEYLEHAKINSLSELLQKHSMTLDDLLKGKKKLEIFANKKLGRSDSVKRSNLNNYKDSTLNHTISAEESSENKNQENRNVTDTSNNKDQETSKTIKNENSHVSQKQENNNTYKTTDPSYKKTSNSNTTHESNTEKVHQKYDTSTEKLMPRPNIDPQIDNYRYHNRNRTKNLEIRRKQDIHKQHSLHEINAKHETEIYNQHKHHHKNHDHIYKVRNEQTIEPMTYETDINETRYMHKDHNDKNKSKDYRNETQHELNETRKSNLNESKLNENKIIELLISPTHNVSIRSQSPSLNKALTEYHLNSTVKQNRTIPIDRKRTFSTTSKYHFSDEINEKQTENNKNVENSEKHSERTEKPRNKKRFQRRRQRIKTSNSTSLLPIEEHLNTSIPIYSDSKDLSKKESTNILNITISNDEKKRQKMEISSDYEKQSMHVATITTTKVEIPSEYKKQTMEIATTTISTTEVNDETTTQVIEQESSSSKSISTKEIQNTGSTQKYNATSTRGTPNTPKTRRTKLRQLGLAIAKSSRTHRRLKTFSLHKENLNISSHKDNQDDFLARNSSNISSDVPLTTSITQKPKYSLPSLTTLFKTERTFSDDVEPITTTVKYNIKSSTEDTAKTEIQEILNDTRTSAKLSKILMERNMTLNELVEHRERGSSNVHLADIFHNASKEPNPDPEPFLSKSLIEPISKETYPLRALLEANQHDPFNKGTTAEISHTTSRSIQLDSKGTPYVSTVIGGNAAMVDEDSLQQNYAVTINRNSNPQILMEMINNYEYTGKNNNTTENTAEMTARLRNKKELEIDGELSNITKDVQPLHGNDSKIGSPISENEVVLTDPPKSAFAQSFSKSVFLTVASMMGVITILFLLTYASIKCIQERRSLKSKEKRCIPTPVFELMRDEKVRKKHHLNTIITTNNIYSFAASESQKSGDETPEYEWENLRNPL